MNVFLAETVVHQLALLLHWRREANRAIMVVEGARAPRHRPAQQK